MVNEVNQKISNENLLRSFREASSEINRIATDEIAPSAAIIEDAFATAGRSIATELAKAAQKGELSLNSLGQTLARNIGGVAIDSLVRKPIENLLGNLFSAPFGGARANGGTVAPGASFLVGERGPELFTPSVSGRVGAIGSPSMSVNITLPGVRDVEGFRQSQTQIAAAASRIIGRGQRNL